jgi:hypothetical protein
MRPPGRVLAVRELGAPSSAPVVFSRCGGGPTWEEPPLELLQPFDTCQPSHRASGSGGGSGDGVGEEPRLALVGTLDGALHLFRVHITTSCGEAGPGGLLAGSRQVAAEGELALSAVWVSGRGGPPLFSAPVLMPPLGAAAVCAGQSRAATAADGHGSGGDGLGSSSQGTSSSGTCEAGHGAWALAVVARVDGAVTGQALSGEVRAGGPRGMRMAVRASARYQPTRVLRVAAGAAKLVRECIAHRHLRHAWARALCCGGSGCGRPVC